MAEKPPVWAATPCVTIGTGPGHAQPDGLLLLRLLGPPPPATHPPACPSAP